MVLMLVGICWLFAVLLIVCVCLAGSERRRQHDRATAPQMGEPVTSGMLAIPRAPYEQPHPAPDRAPAALAQTAS